MSGVLGQNFARVGQVRVWVGHGLPSLIARTLSAVFLHDISQTDAARITELDIDMFYHESWKLYFGVKRPRSRCTGAVPACFSLL